MAELPTWIRSMLLTSYRNASVHVNVKRTNDLECVLLTKADLCTAASLDLGRLDWDVASDTFTAWQTDRWGLQAC